MGVVIAETFAVQLAELISVAKSFQLEMLFCREVWIVIEAIEMGPVLAINRLIPKENTNISVVSSYLSLKLLLFILFNF